MKRIGILMTFVSLFALVSCSSLSSTSSNSAATMSGASTGTALASLYKSKKAGTLAVTNASDLANMMTVINAYNQLKTNKDNSTYKAQFATGMITGGNGLITTANATTITNALLNSSSLAGISSTNIVSKATTTMSTINTILSLLN